MPNPEALTLRESLDWQACHQPDKRAFIYLERGERETESLTFFELHRRARTIAHVLQQKELGGQRVLLAYAAGLDFVAAIFGCFYAGVIAVPAPVASYGDSFERVRTILSDSEASAILALRSFNATGMSQVETPLIATDEIAMSEVSLAPPADTGGLALLQYTSGSTGNPRGVMLTHSNLVANLRGLSRTFESSPDDVGINWLPLYHDLGLIGGVLHAVYMGGCCVVMPPLSFIQKPMRWVKAISRYRATLSAAPSFAYDLCARKFNVESDGELDLSNWRAAVCGGETVRPQQLEKFAEVFQPAGFQPTALLPAYGLAENTLLATTTPLGRGMLTVTTSRGEEHSAWLKRLASCGYAFEGETIAIVDPDSLRRVPPGEVGEVWLQGASVAAGYWNRTEETRVTFQSQLAEEPGAGRWLRTGDFGFMSPGGLVVTGRLKELILVRGVNYDPLDFEIAACESDPLLSGGGAAAFSIDREDGEGVVLVLEIERAVAANLDWRRVIDGVVTAVNRRFGVTIYDAVILAGRIPRTTSGKIQRNRCKELYLSGALETIPAVDRPALGRYRPSTPELV